jgi:hypothetical protein
MSTIINPTNAYYFVYYELLKTQDEHQYVLALHSYLDKSLEHAAQFIEIKNIKKLIFHLETIKMHFAFKITLYNYIKSDLVSKILNTSRHNTNIETILKQNKIPLEMICEIENILLKQIAYMNSYDTMSHVFGNETDRTDSCKIINYNPPYNIKQKWAEQTKEEAINRLILLSKYFGVKCLKQFDINLIKYHDVHEMKFSSLVKYYNKVIKKVKKELKKCVTYCDAYIEIEKTYSVMLITSDPSIPLNQYELVLENIPRET